MTKNTKRVVTISAEDAEKVKLFSSERAKDILALMTGKDRMSYADAVKWSRRYAKRDGRWWA